MTDWFALLGERRGPWLDPEVLKEKFLQRSAEVHPDRFHAAPEADRREASRRSTELNTGYQALRDSRQRLLHLLELETGARPREIQRIPPGTMELFTEIGQVCREADAFLAERRGVESPMLKVRLFQQGMAWVGRLQALQARVNARGEALEEELRGLNPAWDTAPPPGHPERTARLPLARLEELYRGLSYVARWSAQIQERLVQLATV